MATDLTNEAMQGFTAAAGSKNPFYNSSASGIAWDCGYWLLLPLDAADFEEDISMLEETYLGDGLYASFDGFQFRLRAPRLEGDHEVFLEPMVLVAFQDYVNKIIDRHRKSD